MGNSSKTDLQRDILLTWWESPNATNQEIAGACDCSSSYVSQTKNRFDDYNEFEAMMDRQDAELEQMFGENIFENSGTTSATSRVGRARNCRAMERDPEQHPGLLIKHIVVMVLGYAAIQVGITLSLISSEIQHRITDSFSLLDPTV